MGFTFGGPRTTNDSVIPRSTNVKIAVLSYWWKLQLAWGSYSHGHPTTQCFWLTTQSSLPCTIPFRVTISDPRVKGVKLRANPFSHHRHALHQEPGLLPFTQYSTRVRLFSLFLSPKRLSGSSVPQWYPSPRPIPSCYYEQVRP